MKAFTDLEQSKKLAEILPLESADIYTVWVGGIEINESYMPEEEAVELANSYRKQGYRDVHVERYCNVPPQLKSYLGKNLAEITYQSITSILSRGWVI